MQHNEILLNAAKQFSTPCYVFNTDTLALRMQKIRNIIDKNIDLCYSIKANPFLINAMSGFVSWFEVCSPGELSIYEKSGLPAERVLFSGVMKTEDNVAHAMDYGVKLFTAESLLHLKIINKCATARGIKVPLILRLEGASQFGMSYDDLFWAIDHKEEFCGVDFLGLHYFTGTQKTPKKVLEELSMLENLLDELKTEKNFEVRHLEYGPGLGVPYFVNEADIEDLDLLCQIAPALSSLAKKVPLTLEFGRYFAASCGSFLTTVMDTKQHPNSSYCIVDGGIHHINYYGQTMAMKQPHITNLNKTKTAEQRNWTLCGSLCTTADILVRKLDISLEIGSILSFENVGAYSVSEGISLFLSRDLPAVVSYSSQNGFKQHRPHTEIFNFNC